MLHKFSKGAKEDLLALHSEHTYADVVSYIRKGSPCDHKLGNIQYNNIVINRNDREIVGVTLSHLNKYARYFIFQCNVCFDSQTVEVGDPCSFCDGAGCKDCKEGLDFKLIACPNCTGKQIVGDRNEWSDRNKIVRSQSHGNGRTLPRQTRRYQSRKTRSRN